MHYINRHLLTFIVFIFFIMHLIPLLATEAYEVFFNGVDDPAIIQLLRSTSQLIALEKNPPSTGAALRKRAEADILRFEKALQSLAFYDAQIDLHIQINATPPQIIFNVSLGERFIFSTFQIVGSEEMTGSVCDWIQLDVLQVILDTPAYPKTILHAEELLLVELASFGYPLATVLNRKVIADVEQKTVAVTLTVDSGPFAYFGKTIVSGTKKVCDEFFYKKLAWRIGDVFDPLLIEETLIDIEGSSLFSSINITPAETIDQDGTLPIQIEVTEAKSRSLGFGVGYSTLRSFGLVGEYENRNERHCGERFALRSAVWNNLFDGTFVYVFPDWHSRRQDLIWLMQAHHEITKGYTESFLSASISLERQVSRRLTTTSGIMFKWLRNIDSDNNGLFNLFKIPFGLKWIDVDNLIDPSKGYSFSLKSIPTVEIFNKPFGYVINMFNASVYMPLNSCCNMLAVGKMTFGSIFGTAFGKIPPSERLYAGSEETLRGYKYLTVSPLNKKDDPEGGRSMLIFSLELSKTINEQWGAAVFYDVGNVYRTCYPELGKQLQSAGIGIRYHTPVGPLRLDFAFPLNRRSIDHFCEFYLSLGQTF